MSQSIIETALADLITEIKTISIANGYRNDLGERVYTEYFDINTKIGLTLPSISVLVGDGRINAINPAKTVFQELTVFGVVGYVKTVDAESLMNDLKTCLAGFIMKNLNDTSKRYMISGKENLFKIGRLFLDGATKGEIGISFEILIQSQDGTFQ